MRKLITSIMVCFLAFSVSAIAQATNWVYLPGMTEDNAQSEGIVDEYYVDVDSSQLLENTDIVQFWVKSLDTNNVEDRLCVQIDFAKNKTALKGEIIYKDDVLEDEYILDQDELTWDEYSQSSGIGEAFEAITLAEEAAIIGGYWGDNPLFIDYDLPAEPKGEWEELGAGISINPQSIVVDAEEGRAYIWTMLDGSELSYWCIDRKNGVSSVVEIAYLYDGEVVDEDIRVSCLWLPLNAENESGSSIIDNLVIGGKVLDQIINNKINEIAD